MSDERTVVIDYTNYRGERATRHVVPLSFHFEKNKWHSEIQWFMRAFDIAKGENRMFAMAKIHSWTVPS